MDWKLDNEVKTSKTSKDLAKPVFDDKAFEVKQTATSKELLGQSLFLCDARPGAYAS